MDHVKGRLLKAAADSPWWTDLVVIFGLTFVMICLLAIVNCVGKGSREHENERIKHIMDKRRDEPDDFRKEYYSWDSIMVFGEEDEDGTPRQQSRRRSSLFGAQPVARHTRKSILSALRKKGLEYTLFYSVQKDEIYCKIRAPLKLLQDVSCVWLYYICTLTPIGIDCA